MRIKKLCALGIIGMLGILTLVTVLTSIVMGNDPNDWTTGGNTGSGTEWLGTNNADDLRFRTNNVQRMVIDGTTPYPGGTGTGYVGIGLISPRLPACQLQVDLNNPTYQSITFIPVNRIGTTKLTNPTNYALDIGAWDSSGTTKGYVAIQVIDQRNNPSEEDFPLFINPEKGKVAIGKIEKPVRRLDIEDASGPQLRLSYRDDPSKTPQYIYTDFSTTSDGYLKINPSSGRVGIMKNPEATLDVNGNCLLKNSLGTYGLKVVNYLGTSDIFSVEQIGTPVDDYRVGIKGVSNSAMMNIFDSNDPQLQLTNTWDNDGTSSINEARYATFETDSNGNLIIKPIKGSDYGSGVLNGKVGIAGTPDRTFHVHGDAIITDELKLENGLYLIGVLKDSGGNTGDDGQILQANNGEIEWVDGVDEDWDWPSGQSGMNGDIYHTGNVGIGVSDPYHKLHIYDDGASANRAGLYVHQDGSLNDNTMYGIYVRKTGSGIGATNVAGYFYAYGAVSGNDYGIIVEKGDVGIGTTVPNNLLDIEKAGTVQNNLDIFHITNTATHSSMLGTETSILFNQHYHPYNPDNNPVAAGRITVGTDDHWTSTASSQDGYMSFSTVNDGVLTDRMFIHKTGNIGIGEKNPQATLEMRRTSGDVDIKFDIAGTDYYTMGVDYDDSYKFKIGTTNFDTANTRLSIDSSGNVGIYGGTPIIDIETLDNNIIDGDDLGTIQFRGLDATQEHLIGAMIRAEAADIWDGDDEDNAPTELQFFTEDNTITDHLATPRMVISQSGIVGIGITSSLNTNTKLHVKNNDGAYAGYFESTKDSSSTHIIHAEYTGTTTNKDPIAIYGKSTPKDMCGFGGYFEGGYKGVVAKVNPTGSLMYKGIEVTVSGGSGTNYGIYSSVSGTGTNYAGYFSGNVHVQGTLSKTGGSFKIDHPLDPENKYLSHSFVESPDMMNVYNGNVVLNENGEAWIELPEWFEVLNRDFRYQLSCIGENAPVYIAEEVSDNKFKIAGGEPGMKISWQVTGIRQDPWAESNRIPVEEYKSEEDIGKYLHPELYGQPEEMGIGYILKDKL